MNAGLLAVSAVALLALVAPTYAACPVMFSSPLFSVMPDDHTYVLVAYSEHDRMQSLVLEPSFHGSAHEFGMVLPLPSRPDIQEADESIFDDLERWIAHRHMVQVATLEGVGFGGGGGVTVIETKDVGDFTATVLTADTADSLLGWLDENSYSYTDSDRDNFGYYVDRGGYYFVAFKVNMGEVDVGQDGMLDGRLRPIEFAFGTEEPMLPFRIMASDMEEMSFTLYTIGVWPYFVPGATVEFAERVDLDSVDPWQMTPGPALASYDIDGKWLLRMDVRFDPAMVERNVVLSKTGRIDALEPVGRSISSGTVSVPEKSGIIPDGSQPYVAERFADSVSPREQSEAGATGESIECKIQYQLMKRPGGGFACVMDQTVDRVTGMHWEASHTRQSEILRIS